MSIYTKEDDPEAKHMTLQEIADCLGVTRSRVQAIEKKALEKARRRCNALGYRLEDILLDPSTSCEDPHKVHL